MLVAGGAGYIGSHTAKFLRQQGVAPIVLDNLCTGNRWAVKFGPFYEGSIADAALVTHILAEHRPQGVILFAGHTSVGESTINPRPYFRNNVGAVLAFLHTLLDAGLHAIVFSSSCAVYGLQERIPISEDSPRLPLNPYAETKLFIEKVLASYSAAYGVKYAALRYFNAAGADPEGELGEHHEPETHLIPLAIQAALGRAPLQVFGTDYPTPDGTAIRDYVHVTDLAHAHLGALRHLLAGGPSLELNIGTGRGHSVMEVIRAVEHLADVPLPVNYAPRRPGDAPILVADPARARAALGWTPRFSELDTIVRTAWNWHKIKPA